VEEPMPENDPIALLKNFFKKIFHHDEIHISLSEIHKKEPFLPLKMEPLMLLPPK